MGKYLEAADRLSDHLWLLRGVFERFERHRLVRALAAEMLGCAAGEVVLATDTNGKPHLNTSLCVNWSHRDGLVLVGLAEQAIGVDVEWVNGPHHDVARELFSPAEAHWLASTGQSDAFTRLWTAKEAVLKAAGQGIALGMAEPDFSSLLRLGQPFAAPACAIGFSGQTYGLRWHPLAGNRPALAASAVLRHPPVTFSCLPCPAPAPHAPAAQAG